MALFSFLLFDSQQVDEFAGQYGNWGMGEG